MTKPALLPPFDIMECKDSVVLISLAHLACFFVDPSHIVFCTNSWICHARGLGLA